MMGKPVLDIKPIDFDVATRAVETFSQKRNIPSMVYPETEAVGEGAAPAPPAAPAPEPKPQAAQRMQRIPVALPLYVADDIRRRALDGRCSARHIVMKALRSYGIFIAEEDMTDDGRRLR